MLENPKPSVLAARESAMPDPSELCEVRCAFQGQTFNAQRGIGVVGIERWEKEHLGGLSQLFLASGLGPAVESLDDTNCGEFGTKRTFSRHAKMPLGSRNESQAHFASNHHRASTSAQLRDEPEERSRRDRRRL
jgi:hypothetical protein